MTSQTREGSRDRELVLSRHQMVPMWDSSDPERAPPPLPLNPGSTSPITKANVSPGIQAVAANFTEKLRENSPSAYTTNPMTPKSPEKSLIKGQFHKRMQSMQNTDTRSEFLNYLESRSPERSHRASISDQSFKPPEKIAARPETPPGQKSLDQDPPNLLISNRYLSRPIFGESTPPSATMLALQNMQLPPENEPQAITREPELSPEPKRPHSFSFESLSSQILSLTDIASGLQREMANLSRRSKDNATDLVSLKAATNSRDEDIRKSLRDLSSNLATKFLDGDAATRWDISALLGSENAINQPESDSSPNSKKSYSVPRMSSPSPFVAAMEREFCSSPGPISDGSASIALLEKVLREMATKEGQEKLHELVNELKARPNSENDSGKHVDDTMTKMLEEILNIVKQDSGNKALVRSRNSGASPDFGDVSARSLDPDYAPDMNVMDGGHVRSVERSAADSRATNEMLDIMKRVRSSVIEGGGMTNEVKALVRELRGEVLGMGRSLARKLEDVEHTRALEDSPKAPEKEEIAHIIDSSLHELREQLHSIMNDNKRHSSALHELQAATDGAEIYSVVNKALDHFAMTQLHKEPDGARMQKDDILEAVREAWETYRPEIELQNFGLERDEILECLSEGLRAYQPQHEQAVTYDQVLAAVQTGIQQFEQPPAITRDEIIHTIQGCLESAQPRSFDDGQLAAIRDEVLHAVTESMTSQSSLTSNSFDSGLGRDEILSAVSNGIEAHMLAAKELEQQSPSITKEDIANAISDILAAQQSALATSSQPSISREEIIHAIAEGLESHTSTSREINFGQPSLTKDDISNAVNDAFVAQHTTIPQPTISREEIVNAIAEGFESQNSFPREIELNKDDLMEAITAGLNEVTTNSNQNLGEQILERLQQQLDSVTEELGQRSSGNEVDTEQLTNTIKDSIAVLRQDVEGYAATASEASGKYEILDTVKEGFRLLQADLEKTITETSIANSSGGNPDTPELLDAMEKEFEHLRQTLSSLLIRENSPSGKDEIIDAIREMSGSQNLSNDENISRMIKQEFEGLRDSVTMSLVPIERPEPKGEKDDIMAAVQAALEVFHEERDHASSGNDRSVNNENIAEIIKQELEGLRDSLTSIVSAEPKTDKDEIITAVQAALEVFHEERDRANPENERSINDELITQIIKQEMEGLRDSLTNAIPGELKADKDDIISAVQAALEVFHEERDRAIPDTTDRSNSDENFAQIIKQELEVLRESFATSLVPPAEAKTDKDDIISAVQAALEVFHEERDRTNPEDNKTSSDENFTQIVKQELEVLRETLANSLSPSTEPKTDKDDIISAVQAALEVFHEERDRATPGNDKSKSDENFTQIVKQELEVLRESFATSLVPTEPKTDKDDILSAVQAALEEFHGARGRLNSSDTEDISQIIKHELEGLRESLMTTLAPTESKTDKDDIMAAVQAALEVFHEEKGLTSNNENMSETIKQELESLRESLTSSLVPAEPKTDKDEIITAVHAALEMFHGERGPSSSANENMSETIKQELESLRESLTSSLVPAERSEPKIDKDDIIAGVQAALELFHEERASNSPESEKISQIIKQELEGLRESLATSLMPAERSEPTINRDDIIATIQTTLEASYGERSNTRDVDEGQPSTTELIDVLHDGVGIIREDIAKLLERPTEFNPSELLDALKEGLGGLRAEVEMFRQSQADSEENASSRGRELILADEPNSTSDIDGLKALISQIQVKVDAIEAAPRAPELPEDVLKKEHMDDVLFGLHELQTSVAALASRESPVDEVVAKKEHTDAIETLLRSTKSQLDEMVFPAADEIARAEQLGSLEKIVKETKDVVTELYGRMESECPTKAEIGTLETLMKDMWIALDESKSKEEPEDGETDTEKLVKSDLQTVEAMIFEVRTQVEELKLPDIETLPTKADIKGLADMMTEFKEKVEADQLLTGQGFEARKIEHAGLAERMDEARNVVEGLGEELKSRLDGSHEGLSELKQLLEGLAASAESFTTVENVNELTELINREFERARGEQDATRLDKEERDAAAIVKHDESRAIIVVELGAKIDEKLGEVLAKYDEAQSLLNTKLSEAAERRNENFEAVTNTKALAEDIKLVIGSMGDSVSEACEQMSSDTKIFLEKVDVSYNKMEEMHNEAKAQQAQSRTDVERAAAATERVETKLHEFHPQVLESIQEILAIVGQHYNHSQQTAQELKMDLSVLPTTIPQMFPALPPPESEKYDDRQVHEKLNNVLENTKGSQVQDALNVLIERVTNDQVHEKLEQLLGQTTSTNGQVYEKLSKLLDHATSSKGPIHDKLDTLIGHATNTEQSVTQMMKLDEMHKDIMETSRKMNEMLVSQSALVAEDTERRRREAEEAAVALERRTAQKEQVESEIVNLNDEKDSLLGMIQRLKTEKDELASQNAKLNKEVAGLEMALELRHEEMQVMEERADSLEKRILEGVLDHARTVLLNRPNGAQGLNMKKVRSVRARNPSASSIASTAKDARSILGSSIGLALKKRAPPASQTSSTTASNAGKERRILSLSNVTGNRGVADRQPGAPGGLTSLKRSQSVKSNFSYRKSSWGGRSSVNNKENEVFPEEEENQSGEESDTGTERRTSHTETYTDSMTYGTGSVVSTDRHVSGASTATGIASTNAQSAVDDAGNDEERIPEEGKDLDVEDETQESKADEPEGHAQQHEEHLNDESTKMVLYAPPSDSGLGTEIVSTTG
ncbi:hypothetical protein BJX99DRAFT_225564 [Aspergillus californicus]